MFEIGPEDYEKRRSAYREAGAVYGSDLAKALMLAVSRSGDDPTAKLKLSALVLREILAAVHELRDAGAPSALVQAYERAARQACRDELLRRVDRSNPPRQAA